MAWYYGTYTCGHEGRINVIGPMKDREWKVEREFSSLCPECYKKAQEERRQRENAEAAEKSAEMELPALTGSEKQVAWANTLRIAFVERIEKAISDINDKDAEKGVLVKSADGKKEIVKLDEINGAFDYALRSKTSAKFWIDSRNTEDEEIFFSFIVDYKKHKTEEEIPEDVKEEIRDEETLRTVAPECEEKKPGIAKIEYNPATSILIAKYIKDYDFIKIVKDFRCKWNGSAWEKEITEYTGSADDQAAELGNRLLLSGFTVQFPSAESKEMAVSGTYQPENDRWVMFYAKYKKLAVCWEGINDILYDAAKKLPGARWRGGVMLVGIEFYKEVLDFVEIMGFSVSKKAQEEIEKYRQTEAGFEISSATPYTGSAPTDEERIAKSLKSSGTIIEDLIDE